MNELQVLERELQQVEQRQKELSTMEGRLRAEADLLSCLNALKVYGYRLPDAPVDQVARLWERGLEEYIALYGMDLIKLAVMKFAENDAREYKSFPTIPDIKAVCKRLGKNPKAEYAKRQQDAIIQRMKEEREEQVRMWLTPEREAELDAAYKGVKK